MDDRERTREPDGAAAPGTVAATLATLATAATLTGLAALGVLAAASSLGALTDRSGAPEPPETVRAGSHGSAGAPSDGAGARGSASPFEPREPERFVALDGTLPGASPPTRAAIGFLSLDAGPGLAEAVLGPADERAADIFGPSRIWRLAGGSHLTVGVWEGDATEDGSEVYGLVAEAPATGPVRLAMWGGVVVGSSTVGDVVEAWGASFTPRTHPHDDFAVRYTACRDGFPVVAKFDTEGAPGAERGPVSPDEVVTRALVAYADGPADDCVAAVE